MFRYSILICALSCLLFAGCLPSPYYQKQSNLPGNEWYYKNKIPFRFEVVDTTVLYNMYFLVRHTEAYPYSNIWIWIYTKGPGDSTFRKTRVEIPLAEPSGKWLGRGMGELWEQRMPITHEGDTSILHRRGTWEIRFEQNMRINPLPEILQVGLRVEKNSSITK